MATLYSKLMKLEKINAELDRKTDEYLHFGKQFESFPGFISPRIEPPRFDLISSQRQIMHGYESNPVFKDAMSGKQSIEDSLTELAEKNKGIRKILPHRTDKMHNERLDQLGQLVKKPGQLYTTGVMFPDNFVSTTIGGALFTYGLMTAFNHYGLDYISMNPEADKKMMELLPIVTASMLAPLMGVVTNLPRFFWEVPIKQASYLDFKINEVYG